MATKKKSKVYMTESVMRRR